MSDIPAFKLKSKNDCALALLGMINTSSVTQPIEFIKFTMSIAATDTEITFKLSNNPEIVGLLFAYQKTVVLNFSDATNFYVSYSSVLKFEAVEFDWMYGTMILSSTNTSAILDIPEIVDEPLPLSTPEVIRVKQEIQAIIPEIVKPLEVSPASTLTDDSDFVELGNVNIYVALKTTDGLLIKKRIDLPLKKFLPLLNGWLYCSQQLREFKTCLSSTPHNALTLYLNPSIVWFVQDVKTTENITFDTWLLRETKKDCDRLNCTRIDNLLYDYLRGRIDQKLLRRYEKIKNSIVNKENYHTQIIEIETVKPQLRNTGQRSESVGEIRPQTKGSIQRNKRFSIPEIGSIFTITPFKEEIDGNIYLCQEYIERDGNIYTQKSRRIALFDGGQLVYYGDLEDEEQHIIDEHHLEKMITVDGVRIFPSTSINQVRLETLESSNPNEPIENQIWETSKRYYYTDNLGMQRPYNETDTLPDKIKPRFLHSPKVFNRVLPPSPDTGKKPKTKIEPTQRKTPKPIRLENEKVVTGSLKFVDVIGTTPAIMKLNPSITGYTLTALPVKLPDNLSYDLARYIAGNVPKMSAITYLHTQVKHLQSLSTDLFGGIPRTALISMLNNLLEGVIAEKKLDPAKFIESKNKIRGVLNNSPFLTSTRDAYYGYYELAKISIIQEVETEEYQYRLTNLSPDDKAFYRHNLQSVLNFVRRVTYNLREKFGIDKPDTKQIREYLQSKFSYSSCKLNVYYGESQPRKGLIMEISHRGQIISEHHILVIDPANMEQKYTHTNEEGKHARHYGIVPTKLSISPQFNEHDNDAVFYALLSVDRTQKELVKFAQSQLSKVINKYVTANRDVLVGENKSAVQTTIAKSVGFIDTGHGYGAIKKTFLKFCIPYSEDSLVNLGKFIDLKTLKTYSIHDLTFLLEKITAGWKNWEHANNRTIKLAGIHVRKENPGKLMINVTKLLQDNPDLTPQIWEDLTNTFYHLSQLSIGFKCPNGVILTPFDIYSKDVERWTHRIKIQLIAVLKSSDTTRKLGIESLLQREIKDLYATLDRLSPSWNSNQEINKHLADLHDNLSASQELSQE